MGSPSRLWQRRSPPDHVYTTIDATSSRLALSCSLELGDLLVQLFLGRRQLRNLPLQLRDQPHQLVALRGREVFGLTHSQSIKTCSVPHNPLPTPIPLINYPWMINSPAWDLPYVLIS